MNVTISQADASAAAGQISVSIDRATSNLNEAKAANLAEYVEFWQAHIAELVGLFDRLAAAAWPNLSPAERRADLHIPEVVIPDAA